ncbi:hypothetical protein MRB53_026404 [Persea americana]|uniref:Uncharacterized protein n=1 Tax=Persea americana TaxID=3435 RepID=A0ACC2LIA2_PERAE|nr:hypothetical protein MRB53_026404 [Persea americana]
MPKEDSDSSKREKGPKGTERKETEEKIEKPVFGLTKRGEEVGIARQQLLPDFLSQKETIPSLFSGQADLAGFLSRCRRRRIHQSHRRCHYSIVEEEEDVGIILVLLNLAL